MELFLKAQTEPNASNAIPLCIANVKFKEIFFLNKKMGIAVVNIIFHNKESL